MMNPVFITGNYSWQKNISTFLSAVTKFCIVIFGLFCLMMRIFSAYLAETFLQPSSLMIIIMPLFKSLLQCTHSSFVMMWQSAQIGTSTLSLVSVFSAVAGWPLQSLPPMSFSTLLGWQTQHLNELTTMASASHALLRHLWISTGLEPPAVSNSITTLCLEYLSTSAILHSYYNECTWLSGALMILFKKDSVTLQCVWQETVAGITFKRKKTEGLLLYQPLYNTTVKWMHVSWFSFLPHLYVYSCSLHELVTNIQNISWEFCHTSGECSKVKLHQYNQKHLFQKSNH